MKHVLLLLRLAMGWIFFYAGVSKIINPDWSAAGYLGNAKSFQSLFSWFASPENIGWVNILNEWGLTLVGVALILGIFVKWASIAGIVLMALYYLPILDFPKVGANAYLIDDHIVYILVFLLFIKTEAGKYMGLDGRRR